MFASCVYAISAPRLAKEEPSSLFFFFLFFPFVSNTFVLHMYVHAARFVNSLDRENFNDVKFWRPCKFMEIRIFMKRTGR